MFCLKWIKIYLIFIYIPTLSIPCLTLVQPRPIHIRWYLCAKITKFDLCKAANILIVFCGLGDLFCFLRVFYCKCFKKITYFELGVSSVPFPFWFPFQLHCKLVNSGISSQSVHNHFKIFWYGVLPKMRGLFWSYLFWGSA